jgi:SAM-dependent methyltransferase
MTSACRICGNGLGNEIIRCREMMLGLGDEFDYFQCARCRCLQIARLPADLARYYPPRYYSFHLPPVARRGPMARLAGWRDYARLTGAGWLPRWLPRSTLVRPEVASLSRLPLRRDLRILDVGCGRGQLLSLLHRAGFRDLQGVDPFLPEDLQVLPGLVVRRQSLESLQEDFDLVMFHHVLEHIAEGGRALAAARARLRSGGRILVRIPTVDGAAWERYRENWVQLDAPRHLHLHSRASLELLAAQAGLAVQQCWCDSSAFQFWASELYRAGKPALGAAGRPLRLEDHFTRAQLEAFERDTAALNASGRGDQLAAVLTPLPGEESKSEANDKSREAKG